MKNQCVPTPADTGKDKPSPRGICSTRFPVLVSGLHCQSATASGLFGSENACAPHILAYPSPAGSLMRRCRIRQVETEASVLPTASEKQRYPALADQIPMPFRALPPDISPLRCRWHEPSGTSCPRGASTPSRWPAQAVFAIPRSRRKTPRRERRKLRADIAAACRPLPGMSSLPWPRQLRCSAGRRACNLLSTSSPQTLRHRRSRDYSSYHGLKAALVSRAAVRFPKITATKPPVIRSDARGFLLPSRAAANRQQEFNKHKSLRKRGEDTGVWGRRKALLLSSLYSISAAPPYTASCRAPPPTQARASLAATTTASSHGTFAPFKPEHVAGTREYRGGRQMGRARISCRREPPSSTRTPA